MERLFRLKNDMAATFSKWSTGLLSALLLICAVIIVLIASLPDHIYMKAVALAYIVLP